MFVIDSEQEEELMRPIGMATDANVLWYVTVVTEILQCSYLWYGTVSIYCGVQ